MFYPIILTQRIPHRGNLPEQRSQQARQHSGHTPEQERFA